MFWGIFIWFFPSSLGKMSLNSTALERRIRKSTVWQDRALSWHELTEEVHPLILPSDIPAFEAWLYLKGFKSPDPRHEALDFSAYKTTDGKAMLGLPGGTAVYAPLDGRVDQATRFLPELDGSIDKLFQHYQARIVLQHNLTSTISTSICHVIPTVEPGQYVRRGELVGIVFANPGTKFGPLIHAHVSLGEAYSGSYQARIRGRRNPAEVFLKGMQLERLRLPHSGPFNKKELEEVGIFTRYDHLKYQQRAGSNPTPTINGGV